MREIKFRAWDIEPQEYVYLDGVHDCFMFGPNGAYYCNLQNGSGGAEYILEQFTGLRDKNGREIYEGDIVKAAGHNPENYRIEFREGGFCGVWGEGDDEWYPVDINHFYDSTGCCIEAIGNIHENPELLNI